MTETEGLIAAIYTFVISIPSLIHYSLCVRVCTSSPACLPCLQSVRLRAWCADFFFFLVCVGVRDDQVHVGVSHLQRFLC